MFTLKVIDDAASGLIMADKVHAMGGRDLLQEHAFAHLFPGGVCPWVMRSLLFDLAEAHGWRVEVRKVGGGEACRYHRGVNDGLPVSSCPDCTNPPDDDED